VCIPYSELPPFLKSIKPLAPNCNKVTYGGVGDECDPSPSSSKRCKAFLTCTRRDGKYICVEGHVGAYCQANEDCYGYATDSFPVRRGYVKCVNERCIIPRYNGYRCNHNDQCHSGVCKNGICDGFGLGETCDPALPAQCKKGLYCSYKRRICIEQLKLGSSCDDFEGWDDNRWNENNVPVGSNFYVMCEAGTKCLGRMNQRTCKRYHYLKDGEQCEDDNQCLWGSSCQGITDKKCAPRTSRWQIPCNGSPRNCSVVDSESCLCKEDGETGVCVKRWDSKCDTQAYYQRWRDCWEKNGCPLYHESEIFISWTTDVFSKSTCMGSKCGHIAKEFLCCGIKTQYSEKLNWAHLGPLDCGLTGGQIALVVLGTLGFGLLFIILIAAAIVGLIIWKKRRDAAFERLEDYGGNR